MQGLMTVNYIQSQEANRLIPLAVRSNAWVCCRSLAATAGLNPAGSKDICLLRMLCVIK